MVKAGLSKGPIRGDQGLLCCNTAASYHNICRGLWSRSLRSGKCFFSLISSLPWHSQLFQTCPHIFLMIAVMPMTSVTTYMLTVGWSTSLVCPGWRSFPGCRNFSAKIRQGLKQIDDLVTLGLRTPKYVSFYKPMCPAGYYIYPLDVL